MRPLMALALLGLLVVALSGFLLTRQLHYTEILKKQNGVMSLKLQRAIKDLEKQERKLRLASPSRFHALTSNFERMPHLLGPLPSVDDVPQYHTITGPHRKSLLAVPVGKNGIESGSVDGLMQVFPRSHFAVIFFHFDQSDTSHYEWHDEVIHITVYGQMKWWFVKRFLTPYLTSPYEFLFLWDDDLRVLGDGEDPDTKFSPIAYLEVCRKFKLALSTPAYDRERTTKDSMWGLMKKKQDEKSLVRLTNFVEVSSPVIHSDLWPCLWTTIQNDLTSGWGYDLAWYNLCKNETQNHTGVVDLIPIAHVSGNSASGKSDFVARAHNEQRVFNNRFPHAQVNPKTFGQFKRQSKAKHTKK